MKILLTCSFESKLIFCFLLSSCVKILPYLVYFIWRHKPVPGWRDRVKWWFFFFFSFRLKWAIIPVFSITRRGNMYCLYSNFIIQSHFGQISSLISSQKVFATRTWMLDDRLIAISPRILYETVLLDISANYHLSVDSFARSLVKRSLNLLLL